MSTKTRRPVAAMGMQTPKLKAPKTPSRKAASEASKQAILDNYDLEVSHRTAAMRANLDAMLSTFLATVEAEILKIPRDMRSMTLGELDTCWAGNFADTSRALAEKRFQRNAPATDQEAVLAAAKRKRDAQSPLPLETQRTKNPRTKTKPLPALPKRRAKKAAKPALPAATGTSTLPQEHEFNPAIPETPVARAPRRNESFFSENGSPVNLDLESEDEVNDELPDPEAMEAAAERSVSASISASQASQSRSKPSRSAKAKRAPSLVFRQSLGGGAHPLSDDERALVDIPLSDGRTITFNPLALSPGRIDDELEHGGLGEKEKATVKKLVQEEALRSITERFERWKAL